MNTPLGIFGFEQPIYLWALLLLIPVGVLPIFTRRTQSRKRTLVATGMRVVLVLLLVFGLAGLTRKVEVNALGVVFVVDRSASVGEQGRREASEFIDAALAYKEKDDLVGVVVFGAEALVDTSPTRDLKVHQITSKPSPHHSDISAGLRLGTAVMPPDRARRIVLLTDGEQTRGKAENQILLTAGSDLEVSTVLIGGQSGPDALLEDLVLPSRLDQGAAYRMRVVARSARPGKGRIRFYRNERYIGDRPITLSGGGADVVEVPQMADEPGLYRYRAVLEMDDEALDAIPQNNVVMGTVQVTGQPRVLIVEAKKGEESHLVRVFEEQNIAVTRVLATQLPADLMGLRPYAAVILSDVPAFQLTQRQMVAMESYVRDLGRGLMMIGGEQSFGVGGYYKTPVERTLPVNMDLEDKTRFPKVGVVLALDKSCSMGGGAGSKLGMAKEAAILSTELLEERDLLGVIGFDSAASWIVPLRPLTNKGPVRNTIGSIRSGGGTDIYPALKRGIDSLIGSDASLKHLILLSDGATASADFKSLIQRARSEKVTITSLTFGADADLVTMQNFAKWGGGKYYLVTDPKTIPAIFTREIMLASRSFLIEEPFRISKGDYSPLTRNIDIAAIPTLSGYVATEAKDRAVVPWKVVSGDYSSPVLAHWRYGLGRSVAFTSDVKARWSKEWVGTESYTQTWTQVARWLLGETSGQSIDVTSEIQNGELLIAVDAYDSRGDFRNFLEGTARVIAPDMTVHELPLRQVGPGRYEAALPIDQDGSWLSGIAMRAGEKLVAQTVSEAVQPYSPEYRVQTTGSGKVIELGRLGGGGVVSDPASVFERPKQARWVPQPLWMHCLWLAALWLIFDVASRRLEWGQGPLRAGQLVANTALPVKPKPRRTRTPTTRQAFEDLDVEETDEDEPPPPPPPASSPEPGSYAGRLLAARDRANKRFGDDK